MRRHGKPPTRSAIILTRECVSTGLAGKGSADVIVTEGFSGNIALKAAEGTARQISEYLRSAMARRSLVGAPATREVARQLSRWRRRL